jgi:hypothetical protein
VRGYPQELEDFVEAILFDREPISGIDLARDGSRGDLCGLRLRRKRDAYRTTKIITREDIDKLLRALEEIVRK